MAETGTISAAAGRIGLTQSALSKLIRRLEHDYGVGLLERHRRGVSLTQEGITLLRHVQAAAIEFDHAREEIAALHDTRKVELRIHCGVAYALDWIHEPVREIAERHPEVNFTIDATAYENIVSRLLSGEYDAAFGFVGDAAQDRRLEFTPVHHVYTMIFGRAGHPLSEGVVTAAELAAASWSEFADVFRTNERLVTYLLATTGLAPRIRFRTSSLATALELVRNTDSLICLPSPLVDYALERGLTPVGIEHKIWSYETGCLVRRSSANVKLLRELLALVIDNA